MLTILFDTWITFTFNNTEQLVNITASLLLFYCKCSTLRLETQLKKVSSPEQYFYFLITETLGYLLLDL